MPLWGKSDAASNSTLYSLSQVGATPNTDNQTAFFGNTTADAFITGVTVGQFGADAAEVQAKRAEGVAKPASPGWQIRTVKGSRVMYETLVAMSGSGGISTDAEDTVLPDAYITITSQPAAATANTDAAEEATFTVVATSTPDAVLTYAWTYANGDAIQAGANVGNTTQTTLTVNSAVETANVEYKVTVSVTGGDDAVSSNAALTITTA